MVLALTQSFTAVAIGITSSFAGTGGTPPYTYAVLGGGAGGTIDSSSGLYTAPAVTPTTPSTTYDTVQVTDSTAATATSKILVGTPLLLFCDVLQTGLGLDTGRVYLWDQKILQPTDSGLYVAVSVPSCRPFGNVNTPSTDGTQQQQFVSMVARLDVNIISRDSSARDRKEEVVLAMNSVYAQQQQEANSFYIAKLPTSFINLSMVDGAAIPYRYQISLNIQYAVALSQAQPYIDTFTTAEVVVNS